MASRTAPVLTAIPSLPRLTTGRRLGSPRTDALRAYGLDTEGGATALLPGSPRPLLCKLAPAGVLRHVPRTAVLEAWKLSAFWDQAPSTDAALKAMKTGPDLEARPTLVKAPGTTAVYLLESGLKRSVPSAAVASRWRLDLSLAAARSPEELAAIPLGPALRPAPVLLKGAAAAAYLLDDAFPSSNAGVPVVKADGGSLPEPPEDGGRQRPEPVEDSGPDGGLLRPGSVGGDFGCGVGGGGAASGIFSLAVLGALLCRRGARRRA